MVNSRTIRTGAIVILLAATGSVSSKETVRDFHGTTSMTTDSFVVESPWIIDWQLNGDYEQLLALDVTLVEARTGRHVGRVLHTKRKGNGIKLFLESGVYQLRVSTTLGRWRLKVEQLTEEEAELYERKRPPERLF